MRKMCRVCKSKKLTSITSLGNQFLSDFVETSSKNKPPKFPLKLILCNTCSLLQLDRTTSPALLYTEHYGYRSGINQTIKNDLNDIVQKTLDKFPASASKLLVVDIGANDGTLLSFYPNSFEKVAFEPVKKLAKDCKKHASVVINDFFNYKAFEKILGEKKADIITSVSCFYDIDKPNEFVSDITNMLTEDGIFVIQQNYLVSMLEQNAFDNIVHEHVEYYSLISLQNLLKRHNLEVFDIEVNNINGGSFRTFIAFKGKRKISKRVLDTLAHEKKLHLENKTTYIKFVKRIEKIKKDLYDFIKKQKDAGKTIYLYGASTRGNTLLQYCELDNSLISLAVERNPEKWGKKIASVNIPIISEEQARKDMPEYMVVLPWFFKEEFLQREKDYLKKGGHFIFPLPEFLLV